MTLTDLRGSGLRWQLWELRLTHKAPRKSNHKNQGNPAQNAGRESFQLQNAWNFSEVPSTLYEEPTLLTCSRNWEQKQMCTYLALITQISISTEGPQATAVKGSKSLIPWIFTWLSSLSQLSWPIAETCISKRCAGWTRWSSRNICPTQMLGSRSHLTSIPGAELTKPDQKTKWHFNASGFDH